MYVQFNRSLVITIHSFLIFNKYVIEYILLFFLIFPEIIIRHTLVYLLYFFKS